jgi:Uma2 family endonuclease
MENPLVPYADYLTLEHASSQRHEFLRGDVWAMAGGTPEHGRLAMALGRVLAEALQGRPCVVYSSDVRLRVVETDRSTYADAFVVFGPDHRAPDDPDAITNPVLVAEVLSPSTERSDRGEKFAHYQRLGSMLVYVLVSPDSRRIEVFHRQGVNWLLSIHEAGAEVPIPALDVTFRVDEVYFDPRGSP